MDGKTKISVKDIVVLSLLTSILFVQEQALSLLPNIQLTVFLIVLYSKKLGFIKTSIIILIHVLLDNLFFGSFNLFYTIPMFVGWMSIPVFVCFVFRKANSSLSLAFIGLGCSFIYSWMFIIPVCFMTEMSVWVYLIQDFVFEIILGCCSFVTILLLYKPSSMVFDSLNIIQCRK